MKSPIISFLRLLGVFLICLVIYHYVNQDLGFSLFSSIAIVVLGFCLIELYHGYKLHGVALLGWVLLLSGLGTLGLFESWSWGLLLPTTLFISGYFFAGIPFELGGLGWAGAQVGSDVGDSGGDGGNGG